MPNVTNLAQLCREAAAYAADMGQRAWAEALDAAAAAAEAMGEWEAEQLGVDLATTLEDMAGVR